MRPARVQVQVGQDPGAVLERVVRAGSRATPGREPLVERRQLAGHRLEALRLGPGSRLGSLARAVLGILGEARDRGGRELGLLADAGRVDDRGARSGRLEAEPVQALRCRDEDRARVQELGARLAGAKRLDPHAVEHGARDERAAEHRPRANEHDFPPREIAQRAKHGARDGARRRAPLDRDHVALRRGGEALDVHALGDDAVVAGEALAGGRRGALGRREQRVDAVEQALALRLAGRVGEALRREERRDGERLRVAEREVREARQARLDPVDDVVAPFAEREVEVEAGADRHAHLRAPRDRHRRPDGDQLRVGAALQDLPPGCEIARAIRRGEHRHVVAERPQLPGDPVDVLVDGVRLRPGEGRDEADSEAHGSPSSPAG